LTVGAVVDFIEEYAKPMALRVYGDAALPQVERDAAVIARFIVRHRREKINAKALRREPGFNGPKDAARMNAAVDLLCDCHWLQEAGTRQGATPGRKSADYIVNPRVLTSG
jgi:hypothetical protein